jgi:membrane-bound lytic murein transglycosylase
MQPICTHKIGSHNSNPSYAYPVIRLPQEFIGLIGKRAKIYQTEYEGEHAFVITISESVDKFCANFEQNQMIKRLNALESEISELKSFIFQKASSSDSKGKKGAPESGFEPESEPSIGRLPR